MKLYVGTHHIETSRDFYLASEAELQEIEPLLACIETIFPTAKSVTELTSEQYVETGLSRQDEEILNRLQKHAGRSEGEVYVRMLAIGSYTAALLSFDSFHSLVVDTKDLQPILNYLGDNTKIAS